MKLKQIATLTALMAVAAGVCSAQTNTIVGTTTDFNKVNIAIVLQTQSTNTTEAKWAITKYKITNKQLLVILSHVFNQPSWTNNVTKAQLEYDWDTYALVVADKTGTNILGYLDQAHNTTNSYLNLDFYHEEGPYSGKETVNGENYVSVNIGELEFFDEAFDIDIKGYGLNTEKYTENYKNNKWTDSEKFNITGSWNSERGTDIFAGKIIAIGKGVYPQD